MKDIRDSGLIQDEPLIFEQGGKGRKGYSLPRWDVEEVEAKNLIPSHLLRKEIAGFPQLSEAQRRGREERRARSTAPSSLRMVEL